MPGLFPGCSSKDCQPSLIRNEAQIGAIMLDFHRLVILSALLFSIKRMKFV